MSIYRNIKKVCSWLVAIPGPVLLFGLMSLSIDLDNKNMVKGDFLVMGWSVFISTLSLIVYCLTIKIELYEQNKKRYEKVR